MNKKSPHDPELALLVQSGLWWGREDDGYWIDNRIWQILSNNLNDSEWKIWTDKIMKTSEKARGQAIDGQWK